MKTDLKKILSIGGQPGLYLYLSQARNGAVVESLATKQRTSFGLNANMTSMADISIYTDSGEVKLKEVFEKMHATLGEAQAPSAKSDAKLLKELFLKVIPDYDQDRFYVSHMKKVVEWYNFLKQNLSLDFTDEEPVNDENVPDVPEKK